MFKRLIAALRVAVSFSFLVMKISVIMHRQHCSPVWARFSHTNLIDSQLHSSMRLISGCLKPTQLPWLPVLSNVAPPSLRRTEATDKILRSIEDHPNWSVHADVFEHPPPRLASRRPVWSDMTSVDTIMQWREDLSLIHI